jgi:hypothetical protein
MNVKIGLLKIVKKLDFSRIYEFFLNVNNETFNL